MAEYIPARQKVDTTCPVCLDTFKRPRSLPCLHTFCSECLRGHIINTSQNSLLSSFYCPVCRAQTKPLRPYTLRDTWVNQFPVNHWILCYMEESEKEAGRADIVSCECHPEFTIRLFCVDHKCLCCPMCIATEHRKCEEVKELTEFSIQFNFMDETSQIQNNLESSLLFINDFRRSSQERMNSLVTNREKIIRDIRKKKEDIVQHLNNMEATVLDNIDEVSDNLLQDIETDIQWCNTANETIEECKELIDMTNSERPDINSIINILKVQKKTKDLTDKIESSQKRLSRNVADTFEFEFADSVQNFKDALRGFGILRVGNDVSESVTNLSLSQHANEDVLAHQNDGDTDTRNGNASYLSTTGDAVSNTTWYVSPFISVGPVIMVNSENFSVTPTKSFRVTDSESLPDDKFWITAVTSMPNGCLILADKTDKSLKLLKDGKPISRTKLNTSPWDTAKISDTSIAVSYPQENCVRIFDIVVNDIVVKFMTTVSFFGSPLKCESTMTVAVPCFGITCLRKNLIVSCEDSLRMFSLKGKLLDTLSKKSNGQALFRRATFLDSDKFRNIVFVSDEGSNSILAIECAHNTLVPCPKYVYTHPKLRCPQGIAVAVDGSILVCAFGSKTIHRVSQVGTLLDIFEINVRPWSVTFLNGTNKFIVTVYPENDECRHIYCFEMARR